MSKLCPKCQYLVGAPFLSSTALILLGMEFTRAAQDVAGILFHSSIMTSRSCWMLDRWCFSTFHLRMPHMCSIGFRFGDILDHCKAVVILMVCLWWLLCWKTVFEGSASSSASECQSRCWNPVLREVSLNKPQLPGISSSHAAPDLDATTTIDCRQGTIFLVLLTRALPHMLDTIWAKQVNLRLIRPQDMVPVIHVLGQVVFNKLFEGCFESQLQKRIPSETTAMQTDLLQCVAYGLSTDKLTFHFCNL